MEVDVLKNADKGLAEGVLFTDFYELTMAQLYFREGLHEKRARFDYFFRSYPEYNGHKAGFCINAGLEWFLDWLEDARFGSAHIGHLRRLRSGSGEALFAEDFLDWLAGGFGYGSLSIKAIPEGRVVHPNVPSVVVEGPLGVTQVLESALLNCLNFQTLIATKAARIKDAAKGQPVLEFGLRRAQHTGANAAMRAALIGGADLSSNTGISCLLGYPPKGTHAHSMVQAFMSLGRGELEAFRAYAEVYPDDCILLVDTIDTLGSGIPNAIKVFKEIRSKGHEPVGIRLDSGDLAYFAIHAARMLDDNGFPDAKIVLSNQLDEMVIWQILTQIRKEAPNLGLDVEKVCRRLMYGVGTKLVTSKGAPSLDGVYKLVAVEREGAWEGAFKFSETASKAVIPGRKDAWRIYDNEGKAICDMIGLEGESPDREKELLLRHPVKAGVERTLRREDISRVEPLLVDIYTSGERVYDLPDIEDIRRTRDGDLKALHAGVKRLIMPHDYHVSISSGLWKLREDLKNVARGEARANKGDIE